MGQDGESTPRDQGALYLDVLRVGFSVSFKFSILGELPALVSS